MTKRKINMGSIEQFRSAIHNVTHAAQYVNYDKENEKPIYNKSIELPTIQAIGSEKIHGTLAGFSYSNPDGFWIQSMSKIISTASSEDNAACAFNAENKSDVWITLIKQLANYHNIDLDKNIITVFYEWAGGSIQPKSACTGLTKKAFIFQHFKVSVIDAEYDVNGHQTNAYWLESRVSDNNWASNNDNEIFNVMDFKHWDIKIDFERPSFAQNEMIKIVHEEIELNSPLGKAFGIDGNVGEGMVVTFMYKEQLYKFKVKGIKHSKSKVKTLKPVDTILEQKKIDFTNYACTPSRLEQAWQNLFGIDNETLEPNKKSTGDFIRLVIKDVWKEESDIAFERGLEPKSINPLISKISSRWFLEQLEELEQLN